MTIVMVMNLGFAWGTNEEVNVPAAGGTHGIEYAVQPHRRHANAEATQRQASVAEHRRHALAPPNDH